MISNLRLWSCPLLLLLLSGTSQAAGKERLQAALMSGDGADLSVVWEISADKGASRRLSLATGKAQLAACQDTTCLPPHYTITLTPGQRERLLSALRGSDLHQLRSGEGPADRRLTVRLKDSSGSWSLLRSSWPVPPAGGGLADYLDDMANDMDSLSRQRPTLPVPATLAALDQVQLTFTLKPRTGPGGTVVISHGRAAITPTEGTVPRTPRPQPSVRQLTQDELSRLVQHLAALDGLLDKVPQRSGPLVGDVDGRQASLYLAPQDDLPQLGRPFGLQRLLADLLRSPAAPLCQQLVGLLGAAPEHGK